MFDRSDQIFHFSDLSEESFFIYTLVIKDSLYRIELLVFLEATAPIIFRVYYLKLNLFLQTHRDANTTIAYASFSPYGKYWMSTLNIEPVIS